MCHSDTSTIFYWPKCHRIGPELEVKESESWLPWSLVNNLPANAGDTGFIPGSGRSLEKEMETDSSILSCEIPRTEESGGK